MCLYLLNISVDTSDHTPFYLPEDLSINDQESFVEIVVEKVLGYENALVEYDDQEGGDPILSKSKLDWVSQNFANHPLPDPFFTKSKKWFLPYRENLLDGIFNIDSPPPMI